MTTKPSTTQTRELETFKLEHWPIQDVLMKLADAVDHLLHDHDCDMHGYETISYAVVAARMHAAVPSATEQVIQLREALESTAEALKNAAFSLHVQANHRMAFAICDSPVCSNACRTWNEVVAARAALQPKAETKES
jgi:hypothetical protein